MRALLVHPSRLPTALPVASWVPRHSLTWLAPDLHSVKVICVTSKTNVMGKLVDLEANSGPSIEAITDFFDCYPAPQSAKSKLWELLVAAMGSKHADMWDGETRADMLFFIERCGEFFEAVYENVEPPSQ